MNSSAFNKVLSVVIALLLWVYVIGEVNPTTQHTLTGVPVSLLNMETLTSRGLAVAGNNEYTVDVVVEGQRADMSKLTADDVIATADLFGFGKGQSYIEVSVKIPDSLKKVEVRPARIPVDIEELIAVSKSVRISVNGLDSDIEEVGSVELKPKQIEVSGAKSQVDSVAYIQATLDGTKILENGNTMQIAAVPVDSSGTPIRNVRLSSEYVEASAKKYKIKEVKLKSETTGELKEGYEVSDIELPSTIKIKGSRNALRSIEEVSITPLNLNEVSGNTTQRVKVELPDGIELANANRTIEARILIRNVASKEFTYTASELQIQDLPEGYDATVNTPEVTIKVTGEETVVQALQKEDFILLIRLGAANESTASAKVIVDHIKTVSRIVVTPGEVNITVNEGS